MSKFWIKVLIVIAVAIGLAAMVKIFPFWETTLPCILSFASGTIIGGYWVYKKSPNA